MNPAQNSAPNNNPEHELTRTLQRQADRFAAGGGADLALEQVVSRAGEIRRGRRMRASMMMAAVVVAVAVPIGVTVIGSDAVKDKQPPIASVANHDPIDLGKLTSGSLPEFGIVSRGYYNLPDGEFAVEGPAPIAVASVGSGLMLTTSDDTGNWSVRYVDLEDGTGTRSWPIEGDVAVSAGGNVAAFVQPDGAVTVVQDRGSRYYDLGRIPTGSGFEAISVVGENCSGRSESDVCTVLVGSNGRKPQTWQVRPHSSPEVAYPAFRSLAGVAPSGAAAGMVSATDEGSCSEVRDVEGPVLWKTCDYRFLRLSPDGKHLLASSAYGDGFGDSSLSVLNTRTGEPELNLETGDGAAITTMQWEDDDHVLAVVSDQQRWSVQRISLNGSREYAVQPEDGTADLTSPFVLVTR